MPGTTPTKLPLVASTSPPALVELAMRLFELELLSAPATSLAVAAEPEPSVLSATSVLYKVAMPPVMSSPPPVPEAWL